MFEYIEVTLPTRYSYQTQTQTQTQTYIRIILDELAAIKIPRQKIKTAR